MDRHEESIHDAIVDILSDYDTNVDTGAVMMKFVDFRNTRTVEAVHDDDGREATYLVKIQLIQRSGFTDDIRGKIKRLHGEFGVPPVNVSQLLGVSTRLIHAIATRNSIRDTALETGINTMIAECEKLQQQDGDEHPDYLGHLHDVFLRSRKRTYPSWL